MNTVAGPEPNRNRPDPYRTIRATIFSLEKAGHVDLRIYDVSGRVVRTVESAHLTTGRYTRVWDGRANTGQEVSAGLYLVKLTAGAASKTKKIVCLR